jgi:hypothetical protein
MSTGPRERVWRALPEVAWDALTGGLPAADLRSLLLDVVRSRAAAVRPDDLLRAWRTDRFVEPAPADPRRLAAVEATLWRLLPEEFTGLELSPLTPLGTCAAVGAADQNRVVGTARLTEVVSDPTNVLALAAADRRRRGERVVHLAACHRVVRAQLFPRPGQPHFRLFALVSSARDRGSRRTEAELLVTHLRYWDAVLSELVGESAEIRLSIFDDPAFGQRVQDSVRPAFGPRVTDWPERTRGRGYYVSGAVLVSARNAIGESVELGDGGFTRWTADLMADAKERCLISCLATERLTALTCSPS